MQLNLSLDPVHQRENNPESQKVLDLRREDFNNQCWTVLKRMLDGERLSYKTAINSDIGDIRRRAKDLIDGYGIPVKREWAGKYKEYYIDPKDIPIVMRRIINELRAH